MERVVTVDTKRINRRRIFRYIYDGRKVSRQDITVGLDLSLPTVNQNIKELFDLGYIDYFGNFQSTGGRKAQVIMVPPDIRYAVSINIRANYVRASLINLYGESVCAKEYNEKFAADEHYAKLLGRIEKDMVQVADGGRENVLGVGITIPGIIDRRQNRIVSAPTLNLTDFEIEKLTKYIDMRCSVENDANSFAYTQMWKDNRYDKTVFLLVDWGVGGSIVMGKDAVTGLQSQSGEFGHMIIHSDGKRCSCGRKGCLESYVSTSVLSADLGISISEFFKSVETNEDYRKILDEYLDNLALGVNNISTIFEAPVIIGGEIAKYLEKYMDTLQEKIAAYNAGFMRKAEVMLCRYGKEESMIGAALMYIGEFLEQI